MIIYCCTSAPVFFSGWNGCNCSVWMDAVNGARIVTSKYENYCSVENEAREKEWKRRTFEIRIWLNKVVDLVWHLFANIVRSTRSCCEHFCCKLQLKSGDIRAIVPAHSHSMANEIVRFSMLHIRIQITLHRTIKIQLHSASFYKCPSADFLCNTDISFTMFIVLCLQLHIQSTTRRSFATAAPDATFLIRSVSCIASFRSACIFINQMLIIVKSE